MNRIKEVLEQKGIKQVWLAVQLSKSYNIVNNSIQNMSQPSIEILYKIADISNIIPKDLLKNKI
jgi:putative transcriptional regulator